MERRKLEFTDLEEISHEITRLREQGYSKAGKWDLAQTCGHLKKWMQFPMEGFPKSPILIRPVMALMKLTMGKRMLNRILATKQMPAGGPTIPSTVFQPNQNTDQNAVEELEATISRFREYAGDIYPSPLFGPMDKQTATDLQLVHCAHHLSFLLPDGDE